MKFVQSSSQRVSGGGVLSHQRFVFPPPCSLSSTHLGLFERWCDVVPRAVVRTDLCVLAQSCFQLAQCRLRSDGAVFEMEGVGLVVTLHPLQES